MFPDFPHEVLEHFHPEIIDEDNQSVTWSCDFLGLEVEIVEGFLEGFEEGVLLLDVQKILKVE